MFWRIVSFLACQLGGGLAGWLAGGDRGAELGLLAGSIGWFVLDLLRGGRTLRWLRRGAGRAGLGRIAAVVARNQGDNLLGAGARALSGRAIGARRLARCGRSL